LPAFQSSQDAARVWTAVFHPAGLGFGCLRPLAAQLLHPRTDGREIIGGTGSGHVSSSNLTEPLKGSRWLVVWLGPVAAARTLAHQRLRCKPEFANHKIA
jgi:hypothetical protein